MRTRQRKSEERFLPFLAFRYRCPVRSFRSHLRDNRPFVRLAVLISEFPIIRKKIHLMLFLKKKKYGTDRQKFPGSLNLRSPFGRKTFLRQNKVNPEDDNPQPTLPATIKESHAPLRWSRLFLPTTCATMDRSGRTKKLSNTSDFNVFAPVGVYPAGATFNFGDWADSLVTARTIAATRSVGNCTHRPVR